MQLIILHGKLWYLSSYPKQQKNTSKYLFLAKPHVNWEAETELEYVGQKSCSMSIVKNMTGYRPGQTADNSAWAWWLHQLIKRGPFQPQWLCLCHSFLLYLTEMLEDKSYFIYFLFSFVVKSHCQDSLCSGLACAQGWDGKLCKVQERL